MEKNAGLIELDLWCLSQMLDLPDGCRITYAFQDLTRNANSIMLRVEGPGMPLVPPGGAIPTVSIQWMMK